MSYPFQKDAITLTDLLKMMKQIELNFIGEVDMKELKKNDKWLRLQSYIKDLQGARDTVSYIAEQQDQFWSEESWDVLIGVKEDIEYLTRELSMVKLNDIAKDLKENGYEKI